MDDRLQGLVERLFDAFNRRDGAEIVALCDEKMEFFAVTAEQMGHSNPYTGAEGLRTYLSDVASVWEELLITPKEIEQRDQSLLVRGRVYLRSRALGIRDMPAGWIWDVEGERFVRGRVFADPEEAIRSFAREAEKRRYRGPDASLSMRRLR